MTGQLEEEKMQVYVRLGIRLLYKVRTAVHLPPPVTKPFICLQGAKSRMEGARGKAFVSLAVLALISKSMDSPPTPEITFHQTRDQIRRSGISP